MYFRIRSSKLELLIHTQARESFQRRFSTLRIISATVIKALFQKLVNKCSLKKTKTQPPKESAQKPVVQNDPVASFEAQITEQVKAESTKKTSTIGAGDSKTDIQSETRIEGDEIVERAIRKKLEWAANELENTTQIQYAKELLGFIREGYSTLECMK